MALTFDFGSDVGNTSKILNVLATNGVKSTFFVTGQAAASFPSTVKSLVTQGHEIGNHSYSHPYFTKLSRSQMASELSKTATAIQSATGVAPKPYFRPPYGAYDSAVLQGVGDAGYTHTIMWSTDTIDWRGDSSSAIRDRVLQGATPGGIVLMHVGGGASGTPAALPGIITSLKASGYTLVTVSQLLASQSGQGQYVVKAGDTLSKIAARYGVTVTALVKANGITNPNLISVGQVLIIPTGGTTTPTPTVRYTVKAGDTLTKIAKQFGVTVSAIVAANGITNPNLIRVGQVLIIPK